MKATNSIDKIGTAGLFITALFSPCCFPLFAFAASALGLGSLELFGSWTMWVFQSMALLSVAGAYISYRQHKQFLPLVIAGLSFLLICYSYNFIDDDYWIYLMYAGMFGLMVSAVLNYFDSKKSKRMKMELTSTITCPVCGHQKTEQMPEETCTFFYECEGCKTRLKPLQGDCCVFCSYGTVKCPPIQQGASCC